MSRLSCLPATLAVLLLVAALPSDEFFIVSSVDAGKKLVIAKKPTEVTVAIAVGEKTRCANEQGRSIRFTDLRAGDTVYVRFEGGDGSRAAASIRQGPMTVEELHRRYLRF